MTMRYCLVLLMLALTCAVPVRAEDNPYATHYRGRQADAPTMDAPRIYRGQLREVDAQRLLEDGYDMLGSAAFQEGEVPLAWLEAQARKVGADVALVYTTPLATESASARLDRARARVRSGNTAVGDNAPDVAPMRHDYYATFWMRLPPPLFGVHVTVPESPDGTAGLRVLAVIKGSPADRAGVRKEDKLLRIDGIALDRPETLIATVRKAAGRTVGVELARDGAPLRVEAQLNALESGSD